MRKIILDAAVSLDGLIEGPNGEYDWCFMDQDYGFSDLLERVDAVFFGRKSFELFGSLIPSENASEMEKKFFKMMESKKKYVFSKTLKSMENAVLIKNNIQEEVERIKNQPGKDIFLFGGASLVTSLFNLNLIDEFWLAVHPIVLGSGKPLFKEINERKNLRLVNHKIYSNGLVILFYEAVKDYL